MGVVDNFFSSFRQANGIEKGAVVTKAADMSSGDSWGSIFGGDNTPAFTSFNSGKEQLAAYVDWVYAAVNYISTTCSAIDIRVFINNTKIKNNALSQKMIYQPVEVKKLQKKQITSVVKNAKGKLVTKQEPALEELESSPVQDLLQTPNPFMTGMELFEMTFLHMELTGEAFWAVNRKNENPNNPPMELWPLMPNLMSVVADKEKFIIGYIYTVGGEQLPFAPEDIIHHKYMNPSDLRRGMSPVQAAARIVDTDTHMADYNRRIFYNGATVDAVLYTDNKLTDINWKRLQSQWKDNYSGSANAHRTAILENGLKYQPMSLTNKDLDFLAGMNFNKEMILGLYGVPPSLLGMDKSMSRANAEAAEYAFAKNKQRNKMLRLTNRITSDLAIQFDPRLVVSFTDPVPDDKEFLLKEKQASVGGATTIGWRTPNEVRAEDGDDPIEGGDEIFITGTMVPMARAAQEPVPEETPAVAEEDPKNPDNDDDATGGDSEDDDDGGDSTDSTDTGNNSTAGDAGSTQSDTSTGDKSAKSKKKDKDLSESTDGGEALDPDLVDRPAPEEDPDKQKSHKVLHDTASKVEEDLKSTAKTPAQLEAIQKDYLEIRDQVVSKFEDKFMKAAAKRFDEQKTEVLASVKTNFKEYKPAKVKANKKKTDQLFDDAKSVTKWTAVLLPLYKIAVVSTGNAAFNYVADASTVGTSAQFSGADPAIAKFYDERSTLVSKGIDDTTNKLLKSTLTEGLSKGESVAELSDRVESVYGAAAGYRAQAIARTESISSSTFATINAWQQSGVVSGKKWQVGSSNPCPFCTEMDGKTIDLGDNYFDKGDSLTVGSGDSAQTMKFGYSDVQGPPAHVNCTCSLVPILA